MKYFEHFPVIEYKGRKVRDITRRNKFIGEVTTNPYLFMPYTVKEGERAEDIANAYYGSVDYVWLVWLANNIIDPYYQWPLSEEQFNQYMIEKYESQSGQLGYDVIAWTKDTTIDENVLYYYLPV